MKKTVAKIRESDGAILVEAPRGIYVVYPEEVKRLIMNDNEILFKSLKRGKSELRYRKNESRKPKWEYKERG